MVAVVSGSGLGLFGSSLSILGGGGVFGNPQAGRSGERIYVNTATGNLVIQRQDEFLSAQGLDIVPLRTYNSLGIAANDGDNSDNWRNGLLQKLTAETGTRNNAGATITKVFRDGREVVYTYNATRLRYESTEGDGAHDTLTWDGTVWTWTDGSARNTETYNTSGRLDAARDADQNLVTYTYTGSLLTSVTDSSGQTTTLTYWASTNDVKTIQVTSNSVTQTLINYTYDASHRLQTVKVDLTPLDNSITDNNVYTTTYTYASTSKRVSSITQSDGSAINFTYQTLNSASRLKTIVVTNTDGGSRTTTFNYNTFVSAGGVYTTTDVVDPLGLTTTYTHSTTAGASGRLLSVKSPTVGGVRLETTYQYDSEGNVTLITEDPTGLNRQTTFIYDTSPNFTGNLLTTRDSLGNTVTRTYDTNNQLLTETHYIVRDPDAGGSGQPSSPLTTRYAYDSENHLRFVISADGRVTEHRYNAVGQRILTLKFVSASYTATGFTEANMTAWVNGLATEKPERIDYGYDFRGNLTTMTAWNSTVAGTGGTFAGSGTPSITRFVYDQRGQLLSTIDPRGEATTGDANDFKSTYTYDSLGRLLTTTEWLSASGSRTTSTTYADATRTDTTTSSLNDTTATGLITTRVYNQANELISVAYGASGTPTSLGTTTYKYDLDGRLRVVSDPTLVRQVFFYDEAGRKVAYVDGDGSLTEYIYNRASQLIKTVQYATKVTSAVVDGSGNPTAVTLTTLRGEANPAGTTALNRITRSVYDVSGALVYTIDESGAVTKLSYDGAGRLVDLLAYATRITVPAATDQLLPSDLTTAGSPTLVTTSVDDRRTRTFYDGDGNLRGTLDGEGFLVESMYDQAGHRVQQVGYANKITNATTLDTGTLDDLRTAAGTDNETTTDPERDITTNFYYDGQGRLIGMMDGERFWTETVYTAAGQKSSVTRYHPALTTYTTTMTWQQAHDAVVALSGVKTHITSYLYDGAGRVTQETDWENTVTKYVYDHSDNVTDTTAAFGASEARQTLIRYDLLGRVLQELTAQGAALLPSVLPADIETHWLKYGVKYTYDLAGRRVTAESRPDDTQTNLTRYFYDNDGRVRFEVNQLGERKEYTYNALNQLDQEIKYTIRLTPSVMSTLANGGLLTASLITTLTGTPDAKDALTKYQYSLTGKVSSISISRNGTVGENALTTYTYNAFGQEQQRLQSIDATNSLQHDYVYDKVGQLKLTRWDQPGLNTTEARTYDAFGRLATITDARLNVVRRYEYDRLGRELACTDASVSDRTVTTWDAFGRKLSVTDAMGGVTSFQYEPQQPALKTKITTAAGITYVTHNRHGETVIVEDRTAADVTINTTTYIYDKNGNLTSATDNLGTLESHLYDRVNRETERTDDRGTKTKVEYDAVNRVFRQTNDSAAGGLGLVTTYEFDGQGRMTRMTEPGSRITDYAYDRQGRVTMVTVDPGVLNLQTEYQYDRRGLVILQTGGFGATESSGAPRRMQYIYDKLGRRIEQIVDPTSLGGTLNIRTQYKYDANGNVTRTIEGVGTAEVRSTWYVYDTDNRMTHTIDAMGGVTLKTYDFENRVVSTRRYATPIATGSLGDVVTSVTLTANAQDRRSQSIFDAAGREIYTIDAVADNQAVVTHRTFDAFGRVTRERTAANPIAWNLTLVEAPVLATLNSSMTQAGNDANLGANDRVQWNAYDARGRLAYKMDALGGVTKYVYDGDNVVQEKAFVTTRATTGANDLAGFTTWDTGTVASNAKNRVTRSWYDTLNRLRFTLVANDEANADKGYLTEHRYNDAARTETTIVYSNTPSVSGVVTIAQGASLATVVTAAAAVAAANRQTTVTTRDVAGRIISIGDAVGRTEYFGYDQVGNRTSYTNKKGASAGDVNFTWIYQYDAAGRLTKEITPAVAWTNVTASAETLTATTNTPLALETVMTYDAFGNVKTRTEAANTGQARTTSYTYDSLGRQITITYPPVAVYNAAAGDTQLTGTLTLAGSTTVAAPTSTTTYDVFGNATRNVDVMGQTSYKVYDNRGRLRYEIDALKFATEHTYDVFGNELTLTRYNNAIATIPTFTNNRLIFSDVKTTVTGLTNPSADRYITKQYDRLNRLIKVIQPPVNHYLTAANTSGNGSGTALSNVGAETVTEYNAFGQAVRIGQLIATGTYADTFFYYDKRGMKIAQVDPEKYLTVFEYDETGDLTRQIEYSRALTSADKNSYAGLLTTAPGTTTGKEFGYDREVKFEYDQLNRKTKETRVAVEHTTISGTTTTPQYVDQVTTFGYDALGNQTKVTAGGVNTFTYYDVLGRVTAIAEPTRDRGDGLANITPVTFMFRDAHGNLVKQVTAANGASNSPSETTYPTYTADPNNDRSTVLMVDSHGRVVQTYQLLKIGTPTAPADTVTRYTTYNARGQIAKEWQHFNSGIDIPVITFYKYDELGRQTAVIEPQETLLATRISRTFTAYNAFGDITSKQVDSSTTVNGTGTAIPGIEQFEYDQAGRIWRTNSGDGVWKVYLYDLQGNATAEIKAVFNTAGTVDLGRSTLNAFTAVSGMAGTIQRETVYDKLSRVVEHREITFTAANPMDTITAPVLVNTVFLSTYLYLQVPKDPTITTRIFIDGQERTVVPIPTFYKGVDLVAMGLTAGTHSYRVTFERSTDSIPIAATEGSFSYSITPSATTALTSTSVVGTVSGVTANFTGGTTVRWTASSASVNSATFEIRTGGGAWTLYNASFATNWGVTFGALSPATYEYRITNYIGGIIHSIGRGSLTVTAPVTSTSTNSITPDPAYVAVGTVSASGTSQVQASGTKVSSTTAAWNPILDENGNVIGQEAVWTGTNSANLSWIDVGSQALTVRLYYRCLDGFDTFKDQSVAAGAGNTGMTFNWTDPLPPGATSHGHGGFLQINRVEVYNTGGTLLRSSLVTVTNAQFVWTAPTNTQFQADFSYKLTSSSTWTTVAAVRNGSGQFVVSAPGLVAGTYDFAITQYILNGESQQNISTRTGQFTTSGASVSIISQSGTPPYIFGVTASGSQLSWALATGGASVFVELRNTSNVVVANLTPSTSNNVNFTASYFGIASGTYAYFIEYRVGGTVTATAHGWLSITTTVTPATITPTAPTNIGSAITGFQDVGSGFFGWTTAPTTPASDVLRFRYKPAGAANWTATLTPALVGGFYRVSLVGIATGSYDFEVSYTTSTDTAPYRVGGGRISVTAFNVYSGTVTPTALPTLTSTPRKTQVVGRWGDAISVSTIFQELQLDGSTTLQTNTIKYRYDQRGQLVETTLPKTATLQVNRVDGVFTEYTAATTPAAISYNYYDLLGRLIGTRDANGNLNQIRYNAAGQVTAEIGADNPDPASPTTPRRGYIYNAFGEQIQITDQAGYRTRLLYDRGGRMIRMAAEITTGAFTTPVTDVPVWTPTGTTMVVKEFTYDQMGNRVSESNGEVKADNTQETQRYGYDWLGNLNAFSDDGGISWTFYTYDAMGRKISEQDFNSNTANWTYDYFGHLTAHTDFGGTAYVYNYDTNRSWLLKSQTSSGGQAGATGGQDKQYTYDAINRLITITDHGRDLDRVTTYGYDSAGRLAREKTLNFGVLHQDTRTRYDAAGRISDVSGRGFSVKYSYDLASNRTRIDARYATNDNVVPQVLWYNYDQMNRVTVSKGTNVAGSVVLGSQGTLVGYDARGMRTSAADATKRDTYTYDGLGRLDQTTRQGIDSFDESGNPIYGAPYLAEDRDYDRASRVTLLTSAAYEGANLVTRRTATVYDDRGRMQTQDTDRKVGTGAYLNETDIVSTFYDGVGNLKNYSTRNWQSNGTVVAYGSDHVYTHVVGETYLETQHNIFNNAVFPNAVTTNKYNANGELIQFTDVNTPINNRYFANNANGQALTFVKGDYGTDPTGAFATAVGSGFFSTANAGYTFFSATGEQVGGGKQIKEDNQVKKDKKGSMQIGTFGFQNGALQANFDVNFTPISPSYPPAAPSSYSVQQGDTLRSIALKLFGDRNLWYIIAQANGLSDPDVVLQDGLRLEIPNQVVSLSNNASTFKPFDAREAIGDTTPNQPPLPQPKKKGCGGFGIFLLAVVAIFVTIFTAGAASAGLSAGFSGIMNAGVGIVTGSAGLSAATIGYAALGAAAGSIVSQGIAVATGMQDSFSWKAVGLAAIGGGVGAGIGGLAQASGAFAQGFQTANNFTYGAAGAALGNALTQGVSVMTGLQDSFSWRDVAIAAIAAPIARGVGKLAGAAVDDFGKSVVDFTKDFASQAAKGFVRGAFNGKIETTAILADAFGNALGNAIAGEIASHAEPPPPRTYDIAMSTIRRATEKWLDGDTPGAKAWRDLGVLAGPADYAWDLDDDPRFSYALFQPGVDGEPSLTRTGSESTHFYWPQIIGGAFLGPKGYAGTLGSYNQDYLNLTTAYSQWADENRVTDAKTMGVRIAAEGLGKMLNLGPGGLLLPASEMARYARASQEAIHALNGHTVRENLDFANYLIERYWYKEEVVGLALHLVGDSVHHVPLDDNANPTWDELMQMKTYDHFYGHLFGGTKPDKLNLRYPNEATNVAHAMIDAFSRIPGLEDTDTRENIWGLSVRGSMRLISEDALAMAQSVKHIGDIPGGIELAFPHVAPYFLPERESFWNLRPETHDIPGVFSIFSDRISYRSTYEETASFLRGVTDTRTFVDRGLEAVQIIINEYQNRYHPLERPIQFPFGPSQRGY